MLPSRTKDQTPVYSHSLRLLVSLSGRDAPELIVPEGLRSGGKSRELGKSMNEEATNNTEYIGDYYLFHECYQWAVGRQVIKWPGCGEALGY